MTHKLVYPLLIIVVVLFGVISPRSAKAELPDCGDITGGNVTFIVCQGSGINHFWSKTKINIVNADEEWVELSIARINNGEIIRLWKDDRRELFMNDSWAAYYSANKRSLKITYLGKGQEGRVLLKIDSNFTYQDSFFNPLKTVNLSDADGSYKLKVNDSYRNGTSGIRFTNVGFYSVYVWLGVQGAKDNLSLIQLRPNESRVITSNNDNTSQVKVTFVARDKISVNGSADVANLKFETVSNSDKSNKVIVNYAVRVNDRGNSSNEYRGYPNAFLNVYYLNYVGGNDYNLASVNRYQAGSDGVAYFTVPADKTVFFEGFHSLDNAIRGAEAANSRVWHGSQWKNFNTSPVHLCESKDENPNEILLHPTGWLACSNAPINVEVIHESPLPLISESSGLLPTPSVFFPANNELIYNNPDVNFNYGQNIPERGLKISWSPISDASSYDVSIEKSSNCSSEQNCVNVNFSEKWNFSVTHSQTDDLHYLLYPGYYRLRVKVRNNGNNESAWSNYRYFTIYSHAGLTSYNSSGDDGLYSGLAGNTITHVPTGIKATIEMYDKDVVYLRLYNATSDLIYIKRGATYWAENHIGQRINLSYEDIKPSGVFIRVWSR